MVFICFAVYILANNTRVVPYFYRRVWPPGDHTQLRIFASTYTAKQMKTMFLFRYSLILIKLYYIVFQFIKTLNARVHGYRQVYFGYSWFFSTSEVCNAVKICSHKTSLDEIGFLFMLIKVCPYSHRVIHVLEIPSLHIVIYAYYLLYNFSPNQYLKSHIIIPNLYYNRLDQLVICNNCTNACWIYRRWWWIPILVMLIISVRGIHLE